MVMAVSDVALGRSGPRERRRRACEAALAVAGGLGVDGQRAEVLADRNNTIVRLWPSPIVAKVGDQPLPGRPA